MGLLAILGSMTSYLPVSLGVLLPHDCVELVVVLIGEDETHIVVVNLSVHEEGALKVNAAKAVEAHSQSGIRVHSLDNFSPFVIDNPVRVNLGITMRIQHNCLVGPARSRNGQVSSNSLTQPL